VPDCPSRDPIQDSNSGAKIKQIARFSSIAATRQNRCLIWGIRDQKVGDLRSERRECLDKSRLRLSRSTTNVYQCDFEADNRTRIAVRPPDTSHLAKELFIQRHFIRADVGRRAAAVAVDIGFDIETDGPFVGDAFERSRQM